MVVRKPMICHTVHIPLELAHGTVEREMLQTMRCALVPIHHPHPSIRSFYVGETHNISEILLQHSQSLILSHSHTSATSTCVYNWKVHDGTHDIYIYFYMSSYKHLYYHSSYTRNSNTLTRTHIYTHKSCTIVTTFSESDENIRPVRLLEIPSSGIWILHKIWTQCSQCSQLMCPFILNNHIVRREISLIVAVTRNEIFLHLISERKKISNGGCDSAFSTSLQWVPGKPLQPGRTLGTRWFRLYFILMNINQREARVYSI